MNNDEKKNDVSQGGARERKEEGGVSPFLFFSFPASLCDFLFFLLALGMTFYPFRVCGGFGFFPFFSVFYVAFLSVRSLVVFVLRCWLVGFSMVPSCGVVSDGTCIASVGCVCLGCVRTY